MKKLALVCLFLGLVLICRAQTEAELFKNKQLNNSAFDKKDLVSQFSQSNFSKLFTHTANEHVYGFIGDEYQRIRIKFTWVSNPVKPGTYSITGKSMVKTNVCNFKGTINITNIRRIKVTSLGIDDKYKNQGIKGQFIVVGDYTFMETKGQPHSGTFKGSFQTFFYVDKNNNIVYDNIDLNADGYTNNNFVGNWKMYDSNFTQRCNWGDYRIPNSGDLDIGAREFSPNDKYLKYGWQSVRDAYTGNKQHSKAALKKEKTEWWK